MFVYDGFMQNCEFPHNSAFVQGFPTKNFVSFSIDVPCQAPVMIFAALYWTSSTFLKEAAWGESSKVSFLLGFAVW